jgi:hypothetical protein
MALVRRIKYRNYKAEAPIIRFSVIPDVKAVIEVKAITILAIKLDNLLFNTFYSTPSIQLVHRQTEILSIFSND